MVVVFGHSYNRYLLRLKSRANHSRPVKLKRLRAACHRLRRLKESSVQRPIIEYTLWPGDAFARPVSVSEECQAHSGVSVREPGAGRRSSAVLVGTRRRARGED